MTMTNEEICRDFMAAKNRKNQITVLADLNTCSEEDIVNILRGSDKVDKRLLPKTVSAKQPVPAVVEQSKKEAPVERNVSYEDEYIRKLEHYICSVVLGLGV